MMLHRYRSKKRSKATVLFEFALIMPFFFIFIAIMVDVSRIMITQNAAQDAAFSAARAGAQIGAGDALITEQARAAADSAFSTSLAARQGWVETPFLNVTDNCSNPNDPYFSVTLDYSIRPILPSLAGLNSTLYLQTGATSRCEIVR